MSRWQVVGKEEIKGLVAHQEAHDIEIQPLSPEEKAEQIVTPQPGHNNNNNNFSTQIPGDVEGTGYTDDEKKQNDSANKHGKYDKMIKYLIIFLLLYCVIGVTYLLITSSLSKQCNCKQEITSTYSSQNIIKNITNNTLTPSISPTNKPTNLPTNNPTTTPTLMPTQSRYYVGDYKISLQNKSHGYWLLCDGSLLDTEDFTDLFEIIGYSFGSLKLQNKSLFALPNGTDRTIGINGNKHKIGSIVGKEDMNLDIDHIPSHSHFMVYNDECSKAKSYSDTSPYLVQTCGLWKNYQDAYYLTSTSSKPNSFSTQSVGKGKSFHLFQPTIFAGNLFIYAGIQ